MRINTGRYNRTGRSGRKFLTILSSRCHWKDDGFHESSVVRRKTRVHGGSATPDRYFFSVSTRLK
jgi:hypothetical protein